MRHAIFIAALLPLAACDSGPEVDMKNASVGDVAREMRKQSDDRFINPGKWEQKLALVEIDAPGLPPQAAESMRQAMAQVQVNNVCLTPEQAKSPREDFFTGANKNCKYEHFKWGDGKIDLKLLCKHPNATQTMALTGDYKPDSYTMAMTTTNEGRSAMEKMTLKMKVDARRVGPCDAETKTQG